MSSSKRLIVFLVDAVSFLEKNITAFLIVAVLIEGYTLKESPEAIITSYLFISNYSSISFRLDACTM